MTDNNVVTMTAAKGSDWIDLIFGGGKEFDVPGEYAITISPESLQPFIDALQRFADGDSQRMESFFDVPEGMVSE